MKPRSLKVKGLNSFLEEQLVDFARLTELGLFGIFGPTGSGKSSILDAITLALYGKIPRSGADLSGIINSQCDSLSVYFQFELGSGESRKAYQVERSFKKDKHGSVGTKLAKICDITCPLQVEVLSEGKTSVDREVQRILGLTVEDFTRSVVLPQGSFSEFLKLSGKERRNMLERIFSLEKYGRELTEKIRRYKAKQREDCHRVEGALQGYGNLSEETYQNLCLQVKELKEKEEILKKELSLLEKAYEENKLLWEWQRELEGYLATEAELKELKELYREKEGALSQGLKAEVVKPYIDQKEQTKQKLSNLNEEILKNQRLLETVEIGFTQATQENHLAENLRDEDLPKKAERKKDLERGLGLQLQIQKLKAETNQLRFEYKNIDEEGQVAQKQFQSTIQKLNDNLSIMKGIREKVERCKVSPNYRAEVMAAFQVEQNYLKDLQEAEITRIKAKELGELISQLENQLSKILSNKESFIGYASGLLYKWEALASNLVKGFEKEKVYLEDLEGRLGLLQTDLEEKSRQEMAVVLAQGLRKKTPCPVCGSPEHPQVASAPTEDLEIIQREVGYLKEKVEEQRVKVDQLNRDKEGVINRLNYIREELKNYLKGYLDESVEPKGALLRQDYIVKAKADLAKDNADCTKDNADCTKDKLEEELTLVKLRLAQIEKEEVALTTKLELERGQFKLVESLLVKQLSQIESLEVNLEAYKEKLGLTKVADKLSEIRANDEELEKLQQREDLLLREEKALITEKERLQKDINELAVKKAEIQRSGIEKATFLAEKETELKVLAEGRELKAYLLEIEEDIQGLQRRIQEAGKKFEALRNQKIQVEQEGGALRKNQEMLTSLREEQEDNLSKLLESHGFPSEEDVLGAFLPKEHIQVLQEEIEAYNKKVVNTQAHISNLKEKLAGKRLDSEEWQNLLDERVVKKNLFEELKSKLGEEEAKKKGMERDLAQQKELLSLKKQLEHNLGLLDDLDRLIQGNRLVEFVAVSQLRYIAKVASERLWDITRGRYTLELDEEANFIMRDHFNGGATRATHTLSGGETFLTSLSLALALSAQIQLKGKAPLEFFFLDEGFGTLDSDLLEVVMSSLERLHSQRLSVGLISHVEELKQRLPRKLLVSPPVSGLRGTQLKIEDS